MRLVRSLADIPATQWNALLAQQPCPTPFLSHAYLHALEASHSAIADTGWAPIYLCREHATASAGTSLTDAIPLYIKHHSYGEYVFDWAWADAYRRHGLDYYPKLLGAIPFTPVGGQRILTSEPSRRSQAFPELEAITRELGLSSCHLLFVTEQEAALARDAGWAIRTGVQFHWQNANYRDFDDFLDHLDRKKRKNIRAERRKVAEAGVTFEHLSGHEASEEDWDFFKQCYDLTYARHHSSPYLTRAFFHMVSQTMPQHLLLIKAYRHDVPIAASLLVHDELTVYGRYWGCIEELPCLHFETAYYQPLEFCIRRGMQRFEGGGTGRTQAGTGIHARINLVSALSSSPSVCPGNSAFRRAGISPCGSLH